MRFIKRAEDEMGMKRAYRGLVLEVGEEGSIDYAIGRRRRSLVAGAVLLALSFGPLFLTGTHYFSPENPYVPGFVMVLALALLPLLVFLIFNVQCGLEVDCIYENGITNRRSTLLDRILGRSFVPFKEIKVIGHGKEPLKGKMVTFIVLKTEDGSNLLPPFVDYGYTTNFFDVLAKQLRKRCPNAEWQEVSWQDLW
jgi:hypothetical protein